MTAFRGFISLQPAPLLNFIVLWRKGLCLVLSPDQERALLELVAEQTRLEQAGDVEGLCDLILPAFLWGRARARSAESFGRFVSHVRSAELVSFEVERWLPTLEIAMVRYAVRYNGAPDPTSFGTNFFLVDGRWYATAGGKVWPAEPSASPAQPGDE